jgi:type I restriction enzyme M protein
MWLRVVADQSRQRDWLDNFSLAGQESNGSTWALCKMNMFLHGMDSARIEWCDTINNPHLVEDRNLIKYHIVVANPPFSLDKWGIETAENDKYQRFNRGIPPRSRGDYAFISHMVEASLEDVGKVGVIVPHGVLFRAGSEGKIRRKLLEENLLEAAIGLPPNLFYGTGIPAAILLFNRGKKNTDVMFIDASRDYEDGSNQNRLREQDIEAIVQTIREGRVVPRYSYRANFEEIKDNDFNLNISRYVDTYTAEKEVDLKAVQEDIEGLESELLQVRQRIAEYLKELGLHV